MSLPATTDWFPSATVYEIFVRSFQDSNGDGMGDLDGITARLDHLRGGPQSLGVNTLWLTPVHPTPSDHGYNVTDYLHVAPNLGGDAALDRLLSAAHQRGMRVLLDGVFNHTGVDHPWFVDSQQPGSALRDRYVWSPTDLGWVNSGGTAMWHALGGAYYYTFFSARLPDLNYTSAATRLEIENVVMTWLGRGVDGFRLDAARYLYENGAQAIADQPATHAFWRSLRTKMAMRFPSAVLVGEVWADAATELSYRGAQWDELHGVFAFDVQAAVVDAINNSNPAALQPALGRLQTAQGYLVPFLSNHDQNRFATQVGNVRASMFLGPKMVMALPGPVMMYYGEEVGMVNGAQAGDPAKRTPMPWDAQVNAGFSSGTPYRALNPDFPTVNVAMQNQDPGSLLASYRLLLAARESHPALQAGALTPIPTPSPLLAWSRGVDGGAVVCVFNLGTISTLHASLAWPGVAPPAGTPMVDLAHPDRAEFAWSGNRLELDVGPRGASWIAVK